MLGLVRSSAGAPAPAMPLPAAVAALGLQQVGGSNIAPVRHLHTVWFHCTLESKWRPSKHTSPPARSRSSIFCVLPKVPATRNAFKGDPGTTGSSSSSPATATTSPMQGPPFFQLKFLSHEMSRVECLKFPPLCAFVFHCNAIAIGGTQQLAVQSSNATNANE